VATAFRLRAGDAGPEQQSPVTCGSACLTVARMLVDPAFASWIRTGSPHLPGTPGGATQAERFAAYERVVHRRTNRGLGIPWPRALGTPPWGAKRELEHGAARRGVRYAVEVLRPDPPAELQREFDELVDTLADGAPGLLYVGNASLPRHVVLLLPGDGDRALDVYDPGTGRVSHFRRDDLVERRLRLSGWDVAWLAVRPDGLRSVRDPEYAQGFDPAPA
jgi:hypothetical protein